MKIIKIISKLYIDIIGFFILILFLFSPFIGIALGYLLAEILIK